MTDLSRKNRLKRNLGGEERVNDPRAAPFFHGPQLAELRTSIVLPERLLRAVLVSEVDRLSSRTPTGDSELVRFFSHFFDPTAADTKERDSWVFDFKRNPPKTVLGYPKTTSEWPLFAITLGAEEEAESPLGKYIGETLPGERAPGREDAVYEGAFFDCTWNVMVLATNPDQCIYIYHFAKLTLMGARTFLEASGVIDTTFSGAELNPQEYGLPDTLFARQLIVRGKVTQSIPVLQTYRDADRLQLGGIFSDDVVVDGLRGGVHAEPDGTDNDCDDEASEG